MPMASMDDDMMDNRGAPVNWIPEDASLEYSFAEIYTGPRPECVPKAEPFDPVVAAFFRKQQVIPLNPVSRIVEHPESVTLDEGFVKDAPESSTRELSSDKLSTGLLGKHQGNVENGVLNNRICKDIDKRNLPEAENAADVEVGIFIATEAQNREAFQLSRDSANERISSSGKVMVAADLFASFPLDSGALPYSEQEDHISSPPCSDFFGRRSSSSHSSTNDFSEELNTTSAQSSPPISRKCKKGECFCCGKISRLHRKEKCLVCSAKYCMNCVIKAMGSMPEGRKCCKCVGQPISESKRNKLGKPTRMLCRLFSKLEVEQILKAEKECAVNQLHPEQIYVNGRQLTSREFHELLSCQYPPSKLKPGFYWYDSQCGFWGKDGEKPESIISANLRIGGDLSEGASSGSTRVYINNREITKVELRMLKFAGVQCPPSTRLWVDHDGNYQEEGHGHARGCLWEKVTTRCLCHILSLPVPNKYLSTPRPSTLIPAYFEPAKTYKILLFGIPGCGTSTIIKQAKLLYEGGFTEEEVQGIGDLIQRNIYRYLIILLEARERFEEEENARLKEIQENTPSTSSAAGWGLPSAKSNNYSLNSRLKEHADWFLKSDACGDLEKYYSKLSREDATSIINLWNDPAIQATYKRKAEIHNLPDVAGHFLEKVITISSNGYTPDNHDILLAEGNSQEFGLAEVEFTIEDDFRSSGPYPDSSEHPHRDVRYHLVQLSANRFSEGSKLLRLFDDVEAILFCLSLDSYDQMWPAGTDNLQNKMLLNRSMLNKLLNYPAFKGKPVVLFFNKYDSFEEKISTVPLSTCDWFSDFCPVRSKSQNAQMLAEQAYTYIAHKFKEYFKMVNPTGGKLYTYKLNCLDQSSMRVAFQFLNDVVIWEEVKKQPQPSPSFFSEMTTIP
ncbi:hypothetical protein KP509_04G102200 [Ceratopteris richardii]|uniref:Uncharacterized protein n=1 Tax=Ceratopteris richardii TaxID=49495 RepID=A0A8T2UVY4_CERRI|nr:hypothetical protein KP509_04G102200 [Ceratopteris richardii]